MFDRSACRLVTCRMMASKRSFLCCFLLAVVVVILVIVHQHWGLSQLYKYQISARYNGPMSISGQRLPFIGIRKPSCLGKPCTWEEEQQSRRKLISDTCSDVKHGSKVIYPPLDYKLSKAHKKHRLKFLLVVDSFKLVYCYVPKVGTTSWKRLLLVLEGKTNSTENLGQKETHNATHSLIRNLNSYSLKETRKILATYKKFLFVRNPFERILSAYQDKFQNDYPASRIFRNGWSEKIIRYSGGSGDAIKALLEEQRRDDDDTLGVTFQQFARFVAATMDNDVHGKRNEHWTETYRLCHPCAVTYDWVGHYDSIQSDADRILRAAGVDPAVKFPNFTTNPTGSSNASTLLRYYSQLTAQEITAIYRQYFLDFSLFGFDIPDNIRSLLPDENGHYDSTMQQRTS